MKKRGKTKMRDRRSREQDVTNAILDGKLENLTVNLAELATTVKEGFVGVHARQDKTNGNVIRHDMEITELKSSVGIANKFVVGIISATLLTVLGLVLSHVLGK